MTIAFSTKSNRWTTRYSFNPQHYFTVDQQLVSFSPYSFNTVENTDIDNGIAFKHDVTESYNSFHKVLYDSEFTVVSNQNPSAVKKYESLSIEEENYSDWEISVESASGVKGEINSPNALVKRHNGFYTDIPRSKAINEGRLVLVGTIDKSEFSYEKLNSGSLKMKTLEPISAKGLLVYPRGGGNELTTLKRDANVATRPLSSLGGSETTLDLIHINGVDSKSKTITVDDGNYANPSATEAIGPIFPGSNNVIPIFALDQNSSEGMTGNWLKLTFRTGSVKPDFEVYAVNVDQHVVNLDHSLGQNN